jgi:PEP-CTERM motif
MRALMHCTETIRRVVLQAGLVFLPSGLLLAPAEVLAARIVLSADWDQSTDGNPTTNPGAATADEAMAQRLTTLGHTVTKIEQPTGADLHAHDLWIITATGSSGGSIAFVGNADAGAQSDDKEKFGALLRPIMVMENGLSDEIGFVQRPSSGPFGEPLLAADLEQFMSLIAPDHPLAAGKVPDLDGQIVVYQPNSSHPAGELDNSIVGFAAESLADQAPNVVQVGSFSTAAGGGIVGLLGAEAGAGMVDNEYVSVTGGAFVSDNGLFNPARRVGFFTGRADFSRLTTDGRDLFDNAVAWLLAGEVLAADGDMNGDGAIDNEDIGPFVLALVDEDAYRAQFAVLNPDKLGDVNNDLAFDNEDIAPFVTLLLGGGGEATPVPEPATVVLFVLGGLGVVGFARRRL